MNPSIDRASTEILLGELKGQIVGIAESQRRLESGLIEHVKSQEIVRQVVTALNAMDRAITANPRGDCFPAIYINQKVY